MKLIRCVLLTAIVTWCAAGKLKQSLFSNLVSIDMQFLSAHRNELIAKYVGDEDCMVYEQITKDMHLRRNYVEVIIRGDLKNRGDKSVDSFVFLLPYHEAFQVPSRGRCASTAALCRRSIGGQSTVNRRSITASSLLLHRSFAGQHPPRERPGPKRAAVPSAAGAQA